MHVHVPIPTVAAKFAPVTSCISLWTQSYPLHSVMHSHVTHANHTFIHLLKPHTYPIQPLTSLYSTVTLHVHVTCTCTCI